MIVCHCLNISDHEIRSAISWMRAADPQTIITPGKIYHALGKRADCGGCMPLFLDTMRKSASFKVPMNPRAFRLPAEAHAETTGKRDEGRQEGYRVSERGASV
jgi:bacterioferritin-associated ferredoxin